MLLPGGFKGMIIIYVRVENIQNEMAYMMALCEELKGHQWSSLRYTET